MQVAWVQSLVRELKVKVLIAQSCLTLCNPMDCCPPGSSVHGNLQARILEWVSISFSGDLPDPGIKPGSLVLADGFFYCLSHQGSRDYLIFKDIIRRKNTGVGSHFFLQRIFLTQMSNPGLLHCRQILCRLCHQ